MRERLLELASERPRFGYRRFHELLVREGWTINRKRVYRVYRELGLAVRRKKRKQVAQANRLPRVVPIAANIQQCSNAEPTRELDPEEARNLAELGWRSILGHRPNELWS